MERRWGGGRPRELWLLRLGDAGLLVPVGGFWGVDFGVGVGTLVLGVYMRVEVEVVEALGGVVARVRGRWGDGGRWHRVGFRVGGLGTVRRGECGGTARGLRAEGVIQTLGTEGVEVLRLLRLEVWAVVGVIAVKAVI